MEVEAVEGLDPGLHPELAYGDLLAKSKAVHRKQVEQR